MLARMARRLSSRGPSTSRRLPAGSALTSKTFSLDGSLDGSYYNVTRGSRVPGHGPQGGKAWLPAARSPSGGAGPQDAGHDRQNLALSSKHAPCGHRRRRVRRAVCRPIAQKSPPAGHAHRPQELPPVSAAAPPGGHRRTVAGQHRLAVAGDPPTAEKRPRPTGGGDGG